MENGQEGASGEADAWLMVLPKGITGFFAYKDESVACVDGREFSRACHEIAREKRGQLTDLQAQPAAGRNFYSARFVWPDRSRCVLCNAQFPYLAFTPGTCDGSDWVFLDDQELAAAFGEHGSFEVLSSEFLLLPPQKNHLARLSPAELAQIEYWRPHCLGDIIFNRWD